MYWGQRLFSQTASKWVAFTLKIDKIKCMNGHLNFTNTPLVLCPKRGGDPCLGRKNDGFDHERARQMISRFISAQAYLTTNCHVYDSFSDNIVS